MKLPASKPTPTSIDPLDFGLIAAARIGAWSVEIDQTVSGNEQWFAQIEGPAAYFYFEIPSAAAIDEPARLFAERVVGKGPSAELQAISIEFGNFGGRPVSLLFDDEFADRCCFLVSDGRGSTVRFSLVGKDFVDLAGAIQKVADEMRRDGWLGDG